MADSAAIAKKLVAHAMDDSADKQDYVGLELLKELDGLVMEQSWEAIETYSNWFESGNRYWVYDKNAKVRLFRLKEESTCCSCCCRQCCGPHRPFVVNVYDATGEEGKLLLVLKRGYAACGWAVIPCCRHNVDVHYMVDDDGNELKSTGSDTLMSRVAVPFCGGCCTPTWNINDKRGNRFAAVTGRNCFISDVCGTTFDIRDENGKDIGDLSKIGAKSVSNVVKEMTTDVDKFKLDFPADASPAIKMAMMAALVQIDFTFFEDNRTPRECKCCDLYCCGWPCPCFPGFCCPCCITSQAQRNKKEKEKKGGAPATEEMER